MFLPNFHTKKFGRKYLSSQQCFLCFFHSTKIKAVNDLLHQCGDCVIAKIADTSFMRMMYLLVVSSVFASGFVE